MKFGVVFLTLWLAFPLYAADVIVAPGDPIPGDVSGTVLLLAGEHITRETLKITASMTLTAEPGAVWTFAPSSAAQDPAIAVHADDVTIQNLTLQSGDSTVTAIVSGRPVGSIPPAPPDPNPSHRFTCANNTITGFLDGILHVYGDQFVARDNTVIGVEAPVDANALLTVGILSTMGSDAVIENNQVSGFSVGIFPSGAHGSAFKNILRGNNIGVLL